MVNNELKKRIDLLSIGDESKQTLIALMSYFPPNDAVAFLQFFEEQPSRAEKLCAIMAQKFKAIHDENATAWDKALASELALLMQAD